MMSDKDSVLDKCISHTIVVLLVFMLVFPVFLTTNARADRERSVSIPPGEHVLEHVTIESGFVGVDASIEEGNVFSVFVYNEDEYQTYLDEGNMNISGYVVERRVQEVSENKKIQEDVYVVFENPDEEDIRIEYRVYWAEEGDVWKIGALGCGLMIIVLVLVAVFVFKYRVWAKRKVYGWFGDGEDDKLTDNNSDVDSDEEEGVDEEVERLRKRLEELENKRDGKNDEEEQSG